MATTCIRLLGWSVALVVILLTGCGNSPANMFGDPSAEQSTPAAPNLDGAWVLSADAGGFVFFGCLEIDGGRPVTYYDGCGNVNTLVTSKPIAFDDAGPVIEFTAFDATGFAYDITIFATRRTDDFFDILFVGDDAFGFVSIDGQMERF